jgi:hypothetical protein
MTYEAEYDGALDGLPDEGFPDRLQVATVFKLVAFDLACRRHGLDAFADLRDILTQLPRIGPTPPRDDLLPLLPDRWNKQ